MNTILMGVGIGGAKWDVPTPEILDTKNCHEKLNKNNFTRTYVIGNTGTKCFN